ncbi:MAG: hypothetical protein LBF16_03420 [Pseudomonadales bacterium]|jgi:hypothetical protein|nr:hypothetical protein [Pseudomonadales bacterium]
MRQVVNLDTPLLRLSTNDYFTLRDALQGVSVFGGIGSGKTSGSGAALARAYLRAGMGGLVLCAKPEEAALWHRYCAETNRSASLLVIDGNEPGFNFIAYELSRHGAAGVNNVIDALMRVLEIARAASPNPGRMGESFWEDTTRQILRNAVPVLYAATGTVRIADLLRLVREAPTSPEQMRDADWQQRSFFYAMFRRAADRLDDASGEQAAAYWRHDFATLDAKTRGNIVISLTTALDRFNHGFLKTLFCENTTFVPELSFHGAILLLDMPALTRNESGIIAQQLIKYMWQRAVLARNGLAPAHQERPVFLYADECHLFTTTFDAEFQSLCRGSRCCTVFLTQNLPTYYAKMGGENARDRVHHLLGNFATRIWHNNACDTTNEHAAKTIGRVLQQRGNYSENAGSSASYGTSAGGGSNRGSNRSSGATASISGSGQGPGSSWSYGTTSSRGTSEGTSSSWGRNHSVGTSQGVSRGYSEAMDWLIEPAEFGRMLKTGGPANGNIVSAVWYSASRRFEESRGNALLVEFRQ